MATFLGRVRGSGASDAKRCGSYASHISASVQSYHGSLTMEMFYPDEDGVINETEPWIQVYHHGG